jgi:hypothetical protein
MVEELKDIQSKLGLAEGMLRGICEVLDRLAGRGGAAEDITKQLQAQGKRVEI